MYFLDYNVMADILGDFSPVTSHRKPISEVQEVCTQLTQRQLPELQLFCGEDILPTELVLRLSVCVREMRGEGALRVDPELCTC